MRRLAIGDRVRYARDNTRTGTVTGFTLQEVKVRWDEYRTVRGENWTCILEKNLSIIT